MIEQLKCFQFNAVQVHMSIIWGPEQASIEYSANPVEVLHWGDYIGDSAQGAEIVWATPAWILIDMIFKLRDNLLPGHEVGVDHDGHLLLEVFQYPHLLLL